MTDDAAERFELLYRQHRHAVLRYTLARVDPESAKDATAETFLIAWRRLPDVPDEPAPWLFAVARKVIAGQLRSHSRREALRARLEVTSEDGSGAGEIGEDVAERAAVLTALMLHRQSCPAAAGTPTADSLKLLASWAATTEKAGDLPAHI